MINSGGNKGKGSDSIASGQSTSKSFQGVPTQNSFQQHEGRSKVDRAQLNAFLNGKSGDRSSQLGNNPSDGKPTFYGQQLQSGSTQTDRGARNVQAQRPNDEQVRNFLKLGGNDAARIAGSDNHNPGGKGRGDGDAQSLFRNRDGNNRDGGHQSQNLGDRFSAENKRFKPDGGSNTPLNGPGNNGANKLGSNDGHGSDRLGKHLGLDNAKGSGGFNNVGDGKGRDRSGRDHEFRGSDVAKSEFKQWNNAWKGKNGDGHDHRDWSGKWKDGDRFDVADHIRRDWHGRRDHGDLPFRCGWWGDNHGHHHNGHGWGFWDDCALRFNRPYYWWGWSTCPVLTSWCDFGWSTPYYWDYGPGEYIYCNDGVVYVNGVWYEPAPVFYQQTLRLIDQAPALAPEVAAQAEWLPLGVFAVTPDGLNEPSLLVQLAVTKDGVIGGTAFDQKAGKSYTIQGTVDKTSQRAVWSYMDDKNSRIVMETSVNNLTQNESTGLIHYTPNDMRVVEFVRLQDPGAAPAELPTPPPAQ